VQAAGGAEQAEAQAVTAWGGYCCLSDHYVGVYKIQQAYYPRYK